MKIFWKIGAALGLAFSLATAHAQAVGQFVSIAGNKVNVRAKPNTRSDIAWELLDGYPMQVMQKKGQWIKVKDFEGTLGWVYRPLTGKKPHHIVRSSVANMRSGPGQQHKKLTTLDKYELVATLDKKNGWVKVKTQQGQVGWISKKLLWGW